MGAFDRQRDTPLQRASNNRQLCVVARGRLNLLKRPKMISKLYKFIFVGKKLGMVVNIPIQSPPVCQKSREGSIIMKSAVLLANFQAMSIWRLLPPTSYDERRGAHQTPRTALSE